jgi:hypothetical protein
MNFLPEKNYGLPSHNFVKKNVLCEKGDEITRFDGTLFRLPFSHRLQRKCARINLLQAASGMILQNSWRLPVGIFSVKIAAFGP